MEYRKPNRLVMCLYEALGVLLIVLSLNWSIGSQDKKYDPVAVVLCYLAVTVVLGPISGGHFNPAVTMGILTKEFYDGAFDGKLALMRIVF